MAGETVTPVMGDAARAGCSTPAKRRKKIKALPSSATPDNRSRLLTVRQLPVMAILLIASLARW